MPDISGGALSFTSELDNDKLNAAIEETLRRVQGLSDGFAASGEEVDETTQQLLESIQTQRQVIQDMEASLSDLNAQIDAMEAGEGQSVLVEQANQLRAELEGERQGLSDLANQLLQVQTAASAVADTMSQASSAIASLDEQCEYYDRTIAQMEDTLDDLTKKMSAAFMAGRDDEYRALQKETTALQGQITTYKSLRAEVMEQSRVIEENVAKVEALANQTNKTAEAHVSLRAQIRAVKEQMVDLRQSGIDETSDAYKKLVSELGRLQDIQSDIQKQGSIVANDQAQFAGMLTGLQGLVGGFTAVSGAMALFGTENDELQKVMLKVQSLMSITIGLQQVSAMLDKDSAFNLTTLTKLKEWWNNLLAVGNTEQTASTAAATADAIAQTEQATATAADTAAQTAKSAAVVEGTAVLEANTASTATNTVAQNAQTTSAIAGTAANISLAGAFRMVAAAIKSIPAFGWIAAGITALVAVISAFVKRANEAAKAGEAFYKSLSDSVYEPVGAITRLQTQWNALGDDLEAKKGYLEQNKDAFDSLGASISDVADAERLLASNENVQAFVNAQISKAKAMLTLQDASEQVRRIMELQAKYDAMPDVVQSWHDASAHINTEKKELGDKLTQMNEELRAQYLNAMGYEKEGLEQLESAGIKATETYVEGSVGAIEEAIRAKQATLKRLTNNEDYQRELEVIKGLQAQLAEITGQTTASRASEGPSRISDPFLEQLSDYRKEYQRFMKWMNSGDAIIASAAKTEFAGLLAEGATYLDYLQNMRDQILAVDVAGRTKEQNKQLRQLNDAIAEETRNTVLEAFNEELSSQLSNAQTVLDMLNVIEQMRAELSNDGTELDNERRKALDNAENDAKKQMQEETNALLDEYSSYIAKRKKLDEQYNADMELMRRARERAETASQQAEIDTAMKNRTKQYRKDTQGTGDTDYDKLVEEYRTYEQRRLDIAEEYAEKIALAQEKGNTSLIEAIERAEAEAMSHLAMEMLKASPDWEKLFGDFDKISTKELNKLRETVRNFDGVYLGIEFDPEDLDTIMKRIEDLDNQIQKRNPFKALTNAIKEYKDAEDNAAKKDAFKDLLSALVESVDLLKTSFDSVVKGIEDMGIAMDEATTQILKGISNIMGGIEQVAKGIVTMNPADMIQGSIGLISSLIGLFSRDTRLEKKIKKLQTELSKLQNAYDQIAWEIDNALGTDVYSEQIAAINNMKQQIQTLENMISDEMEKKHTDQDKIVEYQGQIEDLYREIEDMYRDIANDILQTSATDFAGTLGDALVDAFKRGEDAADAFNDTVNEVLQNAIVNQLSKKFLEQQLQDALDDLYDAMGYWNGSDFIFTGLTDSEMQNFRNQVQKAADNFNEALSIYEDLFRDITGEDEDTSLTGAVQGVTEETASIIAGQMNAIRTNQLDATSVMRDCLTQLNTIAQYAQYCRYLNRLDRIVTLLESGDGQLRAQGLSA